MQKIWVCFCGYTMVWLHGYSEVRSERPVAHAWGKAQSHRQLHVSMPRTVFTSFCKHRKKPQFHGCWQRVQESSGRDKGLVHSASSTRFIVTSVSLALMYPRQTEVDTVPVVDSCYHWGILNLGNLSNPRERQYRYLPRLFAIQTFLKRWSGAKADIKHAETG